MVSEKEKMKIFRDFVTEYVVFIMLEILEENVF
jgi:hypothetical protein